MFCVRRFGQLQLIELRLCLNFTWTAIVSVQDKWLFGVRVYYLRVIYYLTVTAEMQCFLSPLGVHVLALPIMPLPLMLAVFTTGCLGIVNNLEAAGVTYFLEAFAFWLFHGFCGFPDPFHGKAIFFQV